MSGDELHLRKSILIYFGVIVLSTIPLGLIISKLQQDEIITSNEDFFELSIGTIPTISLSNWTLPIEGAVENPVVFIYANLTILPTQTVNATLQSVSGYSGRAEWRGVPLKDILELVRPTETAYDVVFYAADNYSSSLTLEEINSSEILLVFEMNGETLPANQGFPLRVVAPGFYGYKWVKWLVRIEIIESNYIGYWESRGWSDDARISLERDWSVHAILFSVSFIFGVATVMTGLKFSKTYNMFKDLPRFMNRRFHHFLALTYVISAFIVFLYWIIQTLIDRGRIIYTLHGLIGSISIILLVAIAITGMKRVIREPEFQGFHRGLYAWGVVFFLVTIILGLIISGSFF